MANTLVLRSRALPNNTYHHNQSHSTISSYPQTRFLQHLPYKTQVSSVTLLQKPYNNINPKTALSSIKPFISNHETNPKVDHDNNNEQDEKVSPKNPLESIVDAITRAIKSLRKPAAGVVLVCLLMIIHDRCRCPAWAGSGGCMGGDSFDSWSSSDAWSSDSDTGDLGDAEEWTERDWKVFWFFVGFMVTFISAGAIISKLCEDGDEDVTGEKNSIIKLQIGVSGTARSLQSELNKIALTANTSTTKGIKYVLKEIIRASLQHTDYFVSAYSSVKMKNWISGGKKLFHKLSSEERAKFDEETLVNVNNRKKQIKRSAEPTGVCSEFIVITILVAVKGVFKLPTIQRNVELKKALQKLGSIPYKEIIAAHVLWTPQEENDTLSEQQLTKDYPNLKPLEDDLQT